MFEILSLNSLGKIQRNADCIKQITILGALKQTPQVILSSNISLLLYSWCVSSNARFIFEKEQVKYKMSTTKKNLGIKNTIQVNSSSNNDNSIFSIWLVGVLF